MLGFKGVSLVRQASGSLLRRFASDAKEQVNSQGKLMLTFTVPHQVIVNGKEVNQVNLPATSGDMGILASHVPTLQQLRPGVIEILSASAPLKYFVSGGFAVVHPDSTMVVNAVEAYPVDQIDPELAKKGLQEFQRQLQSAKTDVEKATAEIGVDVHQAMVSATS